MSREVTIKGAHGGRIDVAAGQRLEIVNVDGVQICDFFAFNAADLDEVLSPSRTRSSLRRIVLHPGDVLVSQYRNPMFELMEDTCGTHDFTFPPCDPVVYEQRFGMKGHRSCSTNLYEAMQGYGIAYAKIPEPFNFFQNSPISGDGDISSLPSTAKAGDKVVLRALMSVIAAGSACPMEGGINGERPTDIRFVVRDA